MPVSISLCLGSALGPVFRLDAAHPITIFLASIDVRHMTPFRPTPLLVVPVMQHIARGAPCLLCAFEAMQHTVMNT